jgi:hypothetical protein
VETRITPTSHASDTQGNHGAKPAVTRPDSVAGAVFAPSGDVPPVLTRAWSTAKGEDGPSSASSRGAEGGSFTKPPGTASTKSSGIASTKPSGTASSPMSIRSLVLPSSTAAVTRLSAVRLAASHQYVPMLAIIMATKPIHAVRYLASADLLRIAVSTAETRTAITANCQTE